MGAAGVQKKKAQYKIKIRKNTRHTMYGNRLKRHNMYDAPLHWRYKKLRSREPVRRKLANLNTDKRITHIVGKLKKLREKGGCPNRHWVARLISQPRCTDANALALEEMFFKHPRGPSKITADLVIAFMRYWRKRSNTEKVTAFFELLKAQGKENDAAYSVMAKELAARGKLDAAMELLKERETKPFLGFATLQALMKLQAIKDLPLAIEMFERLRERHAIARTWYRKAVALNLLKRKDTVTKREKSNYELMLETPIMSKRFQIRQRRADELNRKIAAETGAQTPSYIDSSLVSYYVHESPLPAPTSAFCTIIGWCIRHGDFQTANKYFGELTELHVRENHDTYESDAEFKEHLDAVEQTRKAYKERLAKFEVDKQKYLDSGGQEGLQQAFGAGFKRPRAPPPLATPQQRTRAEFLKYHPVPLTGHVIAPLIQLLASGGEIPASFKRHLGDGLSHRRAKIQIYDIAEVLDRMKSPLLAHLRTLQRILHLHMGRKVIRRGKVIRGPLKPARPKKVKTIKKWWKLPEDGNPVIPPRKPSLLRQAFPIKKRWRIKSPYPQ